MPTQQDKAWEYTEKLLARPQRRIEVTLRHGKSGTSLLHEKRAMVICPDTRVGRLQAELVARALGVELPDIGNSVAVGVSSGVLHRVMSLSTMDPTDEDIWPLFRRLLEEAEEMRMGVSEMEE